MKNDPIKANGSGDVLMNNLSTRYQRGTEKGSQCWIHSPGTVELLSLADDNLTRAAEERGQHERQVEMVRAAVARQAKTLYIFPAEPNDSDAIPVNRYDTGGAFINVMSVLGPAKLALRTNTRERYNVELAGAESPVGPAIKIHLGKKLESRQQKQSNGKKKSDTSPATPPTPPAAG